LQFSLLNVVNCWTNILFKSLQVMWIVGIQNIFFSFSTNKNRRDQLMLCMIWDFHGSDYEECRLLGYTNPVRTSQETHYVSTTESSQLMLCKIWGFHGSDYDMPSSDMCGSCKNRRFKGTYRPHHGDKNRRARNVSNNLTVFLCSALRLLVTANVVPSSAILIVLMMARDTFLWNVGS
jgi:hypothetical protein